MAPSMKITLRLTPIPRDSVSPAPPSSLIITIPPSNSIQHKAPSGNSRSVTFSNLPDLMYSAPNSSNFTSPTPKFPLVNSNSSSDTSPLGPHYDHDASSPISSCSSTSTISEWSESPIPETTRPDSVQLEAAREAAGILTKWMRDETEEDIKEWRRIRSADVGSIEGELGPLKIWVRESLRHRYRVYIQTFSEILDEHRVLRGVKGSVDLGSECEFPGCGRVFVYGDYRVSFEPLVWSQPPKRTAHSRNTVDLTGEDGDVKPRTEGVDDELVVAIPDYHRMNNARNGAEYGNGGFYCIKCFEKLVDNRDGEKVAPGAGQKGKRKRAAPEKWVRPSPLCRIYASVFAETRVHPEGRFALDCEAHNIIRRWKDAVMHEKMKELLEKFGGFFQDGNDPEELVKEEDCQAGFKIQVDGGRGLAECFAAMNIGDVKTREVKAPKRRKR